MTVVEHYSVKLPPVDMNDLLLGQDLVNPIVQIITAVHHFFILLGVDIEEQEATKSPRCSCKSPIRSGLSPVKDLRFSTVMGYLIGYP